MSNTIHIYKPDELDQARWPEGSDADWAKRYLVPLSKKGTTHFFDNVITEVLVAIVGNAVVPITVSEGNYEDSHVSSPYGHYCMAAKERVNANLQNMLLKVPLTTMLNGLGVMLRTGKINKVVCVNNWLFSTNLYPSIGKGHFRALTHALLERFPYHAILFKSLDTYGNQEILDELTDLGYDSIASRPIYFFDPRQPHILSSRMLKSDTKLLEKSSYEVQSNEAIAPYEAARLTELYRSLYVDKYTKLSPQLNEAFMRLAIKENILTFKVLRKAGRIDAVAGFYCLNGVMNAPVMGYDMSAPSDTSLYRQITTLVTLEAVNRGLLLNQSAGAASYKKLRRAVENLEYSAVYTRHLHGGRSLPWKTLRGVINKVGIPIMRNYEI